MKFSESKQIRRPTEHSPLRGWYIAATLFFLLLATYGSLVPLEFRARSLGDAWREFSGALGDPWSVLSRTDLVVNVLLFVPIGFFFLASLTPQRRRSERLYWRVAFVQICALAVSCLIEFSQLWFEQRTASPLDILAQALGTALGMGMWGLLGRDVEAVLRRGVLSDQRRWFAWSLWTGYALALAVYSWLPLDFTIRPNELAEKYRQGRLQLRPFAGEEGLPLVVSAITHAAAFVPLGLAALILLRFRLRPAWATLASLALGLLVLGVIFAGDALAQSTVTNTGDLITGSLGIVAGIALGYWWQAVTRVAQPSAQQVPAAAADSPARGLAYLLAASCYAVVLVILFCAPFDLAHDKETIKAQWRGFFRPPLSALQHGTIFNAVKEVTRKLLLFAPLGVLLGLSLLSLVRTPSLRRLLLAAAGLAIVSLALGIELFQIVLTTHTPDATDVALCAIGGLSGLGLIYLKRRG